MVTMSTPDRVSAVRAFNRSYTTFLGALDEHLLGSTYSLTEARILFELGQRDETELTELRQATGLDAGYLSRLLARFEESGLLRRERSTADARRQRIRLTPAGRDTFRTLDEKSARQIRDLLSGLTEDEQHHLVEAMEMIRRRLVDAGPPVTLRAPNPGDHGWVVERNGALYAGEYGWTGEYEALVARIVADYLTEHDPVREASWIAELRGERVGAIYCVRKDDVTAKLRLLHVEPSARGAGVGTLLVDECVRFARRSGYRAMELWTVSLLAPARRIYERAGFRLVEEDTADRFGHRLTGQTWRLELTAR
ncbi:bifunctional helix-turn-helix transcriptional regulator/GNAT family N-acetyltransferase [Actinophytocola gossypii]|uniref:MarR family transcriptional regulator n=1 Tax=Actinophytocola gossypii TaxID=2812003 RepID=A0ABT2JF05_9PSEU|nr:helix-turn-helix domain-containing GNAT family N-acetyltransferase [Actinophytocola gossypii]MCT2586445.1 MarR family transcriptional regulator [Actinophytocola gossypii]